LISIRENQDSAEAIFIERMGQIAQDSGITRIAGQIWAALVLADSPVGAGQLVERLKISKGSLSTNIRLLEMLDIVDRRSMPGERQDFFSIAENPYSTLIESQIKRFDQSASVVADARSHVKGKAAQKNLKELETFYSLFRETSMDLLRKLKARS